MRIERTFNGHQNCITGWTVYDHHCMVVVFLSSTVQLRSQSSQHGTALWILASDSTALARHCELDSILIQPIASRFFFPVILSFSVASPPSVVCFPSTHIFDDDIPEEFMQKLSFIPLFVHKSWLW